jgi:serine/threonine-protein phosphatase 6 regulatory subunit 3
VKQLPQLVELLEGNRNSGCTNGPLAQETPFGKLAPPLGLARLKAVEVIYALLNQSDPVAEEGIMESGAIIKCLDLFLEFPFNNLLHHRVRMPGPFAGLQDKRTVAVAFLCKNLCLAR